MEDVLTERLSLRSHPSVTNTEGVTSPTAPRSAPVPEAQRSQRQPDRIPGGLSLRRLAWRGLRSWYQLTSADILFALLAILTVQAAQRGMLDDPGLGWHLRNIDAMIAQGGWLTEDPFSGPRGGQTWYTNQWLGELPFWLGWQWAGLEGIAVMATLLIAFTMRCLYRMLLNDGVPWPWAVLWTILAWMGTSCSWAARPNLFTILYLLLATRICIQFHRGEITRRSTLWLLPLFTLWANTHGGFLAGFTVLGVTWFADFLRSVFLPEQENRDIARARGRHLLLLSLGCFAATLVNPYGVGLYRWVFLLLGDSYFMNLNLEWKSPDFHGAGSMRFELLILLFPAVFALSQRRPTLAEIGVSVVWLHFALGGFRYVALWVIVVVPILARSSMGIAWVEQLNERFHMTQRKSRGLAPWVGAAWVSVVALVLLGWARWSEGQFARHGSDMIPTAALQRLLALHEQRTHEQGEPPVVFHAYDWGGYLTWHGWPRLRNWIDDRNEVQGKEHVEEYFATLRTDPGWDERLRNAKVQLVCIFPEAPLAQRLEQDAEWRTVYRDGDAVIFEKKLP